MFFLESFFSILRGLMALFLCSLALFTLFLVVFLVLRWYVGLRFLRRDIARVLRGLAKGVVVLRNSLFVKVCVACLSIGEQRAFSRELGDRGLSPDEAFLHNFAILLSNLAGRSVNISLVICKRGSVLRRYILVSASGLFLGRVLRRVVLVRDSLSSYLSSLGFKLNPVSRDDLIELLRPGIFIYPKISLTLSETHSRLTKIDSTLLTAVKNAILNPQSDYTLMISLKKFPMVKASRSTREKGIVEELRTLKYKFGVSLFIPSSRLLKDVAHAGAFMSNILNYFIPIATVEKVSRKENAIRTSIVQFSAYPRWNISLKFDARNAGICKIWTFTGFLTFLLASVEEEVLPDLLVSDEFSKGDIEIGYQLIGGRAVKPFYINISDLSRHILIVGPTGAGKTSLAKIMIFELLRRRDRPAIWIFDFHGEYEGLRENGFIVISPGKADAPLGLNIFNPGAEDPEIYACFISELLSEIVRGISEGFSPQMERIVTSAVHETVLDQNLRSPLHFLYKVYEICEELGTEIPSAKFSLHAIMNRMKAVFSGVAKHVFWVTGTNINVRDLLGKDIVFDLSYFSSKEPTKKALWILANVILRYLYSEILNSEMISDKPRIFVILEEARYIAPAIKKSETAYMYAAEDLAVLGRKYGISLCFITQSPNSISRDIIDNAGTIFMMGEGPSDLIREALSLPDTRYLQIMPAREALVKMSTRSALMHIKLKDITGVQPSLSGERIPGAEEVIQEIRRNYRQIPIPYEKFVLKLISREISLEKIHEIISGDSNGHT